MSTFSALNTATTALWAQQRAIDVTGQNVANVNTDGYSRQRADLQSIGANAVPAMWSTSNQIGGGVNADHVTRIRDAFLEGRAQVEHGATANLTVQSDTYSAVEDAFREPGDTGLQSMLSGDQGFWAGWGDVMNNSTDPGARSQLLQRSSTLVAGIHATYGTLTDQWKQNHDALGALVDDVNATTAQIADLNQAIKRATQSNLPVNELADKRDSLILHLSDQIGATSTPGDDGAMNVIIGGTSVVSDNAAITLSVSGTTDPTQVGTNPPQIVTSPGGTVLRPSGTAQGQLAAMTSLIPSYLNQLDAIANQLAGQVNAIQTQGYDQNGVQGTNLFDDGAGNPANVTAANISVAITDPAKLAAASLAPVPATPPATGTRASADNGNAQALYQERLNPTGTDTTYRQMIVSLGVQASTASTDVTTQSAISTQVDASRESVSGVNIDEEMTNMLQYQHGYSAAGKLVSVINSMLDDLMNMVS